MASKSTTPAAPKLAGVGSEKNKWHLDFLLERLRLQQQNKSFLDLSKSVRMSLLEKRYAIDAVEKAILQKTLDNMQNYIQVKNISRSWLVERLDSLSRQLGLKFNIDNQNSLFISSDMFYIEICLKPDDSVKQVHVQHEGASAPYPCEELVSAISKGDFVDLTAQLEGLISIYQINAEKSIKCKAFVALQALETDLHYLSMRQASITKDTYQTCMHSPLGLLSTRRGGHPMQITYFVSSYDLIDLEKKQLNLTLSSDLVNSKKIGFNVTVNLEASAATKLQIQPLLVLNNHDLQGRTSPVYEPMSASNSMLLPATFVLKLNKPTPICVKLVETIEAITDQKISCTRTPVPIMSLVAHCESAGAVQELGKGLFVSLPEQSHCYFLTESNNLCGYMVSSIPFSEPQHVPKLIAILRQQALFNTLIASCVRVGAKQDSETAQTFEVSALSHQYLSIILEHPYQQQLTTIEFDLSDVSNVSCTIYCGMQQSNVASKVAKIMQTCMSIPVTMRYLTRIWHTEYARSNLKKFDSDASQVFDDHDSQEYDPLAPSSNEGSGRNGAEFGGGGRGYSNGSEDKTQFKKEPTFDSFFSPAQDEMDDDVLFDENTGDSYTLGGDSSGGPELEPESVPKRAKTEPKIVDLSSAVSITPISASPISFDRRSGIEIIPLSSATAKDLPASITITPINSSSSKEKKQSSKKVRDEKGGQEKTKKKRRRGDSPMGPPMDPLNKHSLASSSPNRVKQSPKHSPVHHGTSPKHITSPKHAVSSPKHHFSGGLVACQPGGKPSMSALKSAATSPRSTPPHSTASTADNGSGSSGLVGGSEKMSPLSQQAAAQVKNRQSKGSLTAVIDKLKLAQVPDDVLTPSSATTCVAQSSSPPNINVASVNTPSSLITSSSASSLTSSTSTPQPLYSAALASSTLVGSAPPSSGSSSTSSNKSSEYMVKHSSDGMKITINKTKSKEKLSSSSSASGLQKSASFSSGSSSPKTHTGLKPGVNSGPASKKPSSSSVKSFSSKLPFQKSISSGNLPSSKSYSPSKGASSGGQKSGSSGLGSKGDKEKKKVIDKYKHTSDFMKMLGYPANVHAAESFMKSTKFQIPKISARPTAKEESGKSSSSAPGTPSTSSDSLAKILPEFSKYQFSYSNASKLPGDISPMHVPSAAINKMAVASSPKYSSQADTREAMSLETYNRIIPISSSSPFPSPLHHSSDGSSDKTMDNVMDFSMTPPATKPRAPTPSHSVHATVVKSPAPSPLIIIPSPRSNEHGLEDDDGLMEELVGITK